MSLPQLSKYMIGEADIRDIVPIRNTHGNAVWHVMTRRKGNYFVKRSQNVWAWKNEVAAIKRLALADIPVPTLYAAYGTTLVYVDHGFREPTKIDTALMRSTGRMLRRIHDDTTLPAEALSHEVDSLVQRSMRAAIKNGYQPLPHLVPTHGDCYPKNMIVGPDGHLLHFIDFEEFWSGDPLADLVIAMIESCRTGFISSTEIVRSLLEGYFAWDVAEERLAKWQQRDQRAILADSCIQELITTARQGGFIDEMDQLLANRDNILAAIESVSWQHTSTH